jgi:hypothetical protein
MSISKQIMNCPHCNMPNKKIAICDDCPCANNDTEDGTSCNLGYNPRYEFWLEFSKFCDGKWHTWSDKCKLEKIVDDGKELYPSFYEKATHVE